MTLTLRNTTYYLRKRVPTRFASIEPRDRIWISLKTDSLSEAKGRAKETWAQMCLGWEAALRGLTGDAEARYKAARDVAQAYGFRFIPVDRVAQLPIQELLARIEAVRLPNNSPNMALVGGILGLAKKPDLTLSGALEAYWDLAGDKTQGKSEDQIRRWRNPRVKAFKNLIAVIGDLNISDLTAEDLLDFRNWWWEKITDEGLTANSGNKDFTHIGSTLRLIFQKKQIISPVNFANLAFAEGAKRTRLPFSENWIRETLLAKGALDGLNLEARSILLGMVNTGYRPSEGQSLLAQHIRLDCDIPHITIEPDGRTLKNHSSRRTIPLTGVSLEAFRQCPDGFPRYFTGNSLSATVNKFLRESGVMESPDHTLYGLRHSFEDRLLSVDVDDRIRADLMGHALTRERYGRGATLDHLHRSLLKIAI